MNAATTNTSQPKTAVFQWLALQRPMWAARLFERFRGDIWCGSFGSDGDCFGWRAGAGDEVQAAARCVGVGVVERVRRVGRVDIEVEVVAGLGVEDGDGNAVGRCLGYGRSRVAWFGKSNRRL